MKTPSCRMPECRLPTTDVKNGRVFTSLHCSVSGGERARFTFALRSHFDFVFVGVFGRYQLWLPVLPEFVKTGSSVFTKTRSELRTKEI